MLAIFPEISSAVQEGQLEQVAILARRYFCEGQPTLPKVDITALVRGSGIPITKMRLQEFGAIAVSDERGSVRCSIVVKQGLSDVEESFLLAHLLGHYLLHIQPRIARTEWTSSGYRDEHSPLQRYVHSRPDENFSAQQQVCEDVADRFAASVLMPAAMLLKACEKLQDKEKIAKLFGVTEELVERRLEDLASQAPQPPKIEIRAAATRTLEARHVHRDNANADSNKSVEDTNHMVREKHHQAAPTPRALAAQSYSSQPPTPEAVKKDVIPGKGMERLREIARMLDKSGR